MKSLKPIPVRFDEPEEKHIQTVAEQSGISKSEIIRRSVRLLRLEVARRGNIGFIVEELGPKATVKPAKSDKISKISL
jgi:hypothetical protein